MSRESGLIDGVGERIRRFRGAQGMTQVALATKVSVHYTAMAKIEAGDRGLGLVLALKIADALGVLVGDLIEDQAKVPPQREAVLKLAKSHKGKES